MDRSLWLLFRLRLRATLRRWTRNLRTPRGALLAAVGSFVFLPMLLPFFLAPRVMIGAQIGVIRRFGPLALLAYCALNFLLASGDRAIYYTPAEVNFLFCGPYRPRQLLVYKIVVGVGAALLTALAMAFAFSHHTAMFVAAFVGLFFALELIYLFSLAVGLTFATLGELASNRGRRLVLSALLLLAGVSLWSVGARAWTLPRWEVVSRAVETPAMAVALMPFRPFVMAFTAERVWPDLAAWSALALLVDLTLLALVIGLNARFLEAAAAASVRVHQRLERARRGDVWSVHDKARFSIPMAPWWGGVGPNLWRQITTASRRPAQLAGLVLMFLTPVVLFALQDTPITEHGIGPALPLLVMMAMFAQATVGYDFRLDHGRMGDLKMLPIRTAHLAFSQVLTPVILLTLTEWLTLGVLARLDPPGRDLAAATAVLLVPLNFLTVAVENLYFLWYPYRIAGANSFDIQAIGRQFLLMLAKAVTVTTAGALAAGAGTLVYLYGGGSWPATVVSAAAVVGACGLAIVPPLALAFERFDVTRDRPE